MPRLVGLHRFVIALGSTFSALGRMFQCRVSRVTHNRVLAILIHKGVTAGLPFGFALVAMNSLVLRKRSILRMLISALRAALHKRLCHRFGHGAQSAMCKDTGDGKGLCVDLDTSVTSLTRPKRAASPSAAAP